VVAALLLGADVVAAVLFRAPSARFLLVNNLVLAIAVVGAANVWAQSGMKARDAVVLGAALTAYDLHVIDDERPRRPTRSAAVDEPLPSRGVQRQVQHVMGEVERLGCLLPGQLGGGPLDVGA